jgi:hypothetical protein
MATTTTVRVRLETSEILRDLAASTGRAMQDVLADAVEAYSRQLLLDQTNAAYSRLRSDAEAWQQELNEREAWEATLADDIESDTA